jgi:polyisoprenoid-binding protein YceI
VKMKLKSLTTAAILGAVLFSAPVQAADYVIDNKGAHASINFKIKHLGYSWLTGRFDKFSGTFSFDEKNPGATKISVEIDTNSVNSNHAERDKHLRSADFLEVSKFPKASFVSTKVEAEGTEKAVVHGKLTLHGVTKDIAIKVDHVGGGKDPWGGFRHGFSGTVSIALADYGIKKNLGPASKELELNLYIEGIRK